MYALDQSFAGGREGNPGGEGFAPVSGGLEKLCFLGVEQRTLTMLYYVMVLELVTGVRSLGETP